MRREACARLEPSGGDVWSLISKKGNYRYFFQRSCQEFGTDAVSEGISDDNEILPVWEGKIFAMVEPID
ncbi:hypothetical protein HPB52_007173 [Rhipicephalus sanguineus]|uniref:DIX domain-containing protein n=1 Tax=Rhipicephalus sanguineus TaxID=34632 RepID=A0A9D4Q5D7_RHISA|nr:hypothetical protein HPB52_007173 [Rhipicephalus sanguineus]